MPYPQVLKHLSEERLRKIAISSQVLPLMSDKPGSQKTRTPSLSFMVSQEEKFNEKKIFDDSGKLLGSSEILEEEPMQWRSHSIQENDFFILRDDFVSRNNIGKQWSEEMAVRLEEANLKRIIFAVPD